MMQAKKPGSRGFTLIELMIVVAVMGILAAVVYPSYTSYVRRGKIATALSEMTAVRVRLEQYYQDNRNYGPPAGTTCGIANPSADGFTFTCVTSNTAQNFLMTATGSGGMTGHVYTMNDADLKRTVTFEGVDVDKSCWLKKSGETC
jgi:type IV pilus assembly protein PilE